MRAFPAQPGSIVAAISLSLFARTGLVGQSAASPPSFEVASVKPAGPQENALGRGLFTFPGGRVGAYKCTLEKLMEEAFSLQPFQLSGGPNWVHEDRYNIEAKPPASSKLSQSTPSPKAPLDDEQRRMLQTLLADRFQLKYHREAKDGPVYFLIRGNKDLKLQDAKDKGDFHWAGSLEGAGISGDGLAGTNESMEDLAQRLSAYLGHLVLDRTGLKGFYDFRYEYQPNDGHPGDAHPDIVSSILASVQGLGLKLEAGRAPVGTLVIDHVERLSEN
jgi:uncharacterized protein (TIGR03435 family)